MDLELEIQKRYSKQDALNIVRAIGNSNKRFTDLMQLFLSEDTNLSLRASWLVSICAEQHPTLIIPWISKMVKHAGEKNASDAVKRNVVRALQFISIPRIHQGRVADLCFSFLQNPKEAIAVKAFSMTVLANIAKHEPDLKHEIQLVVEQMLPYGSAGIQSRAKRVLKQLSK